MDTNTFAKRLLLGTGALGLLCLSACSVESAEEDVGTATQALVGVDTFLYLRCNATGWGADATNRLKPTADPYVFELTYNVNQPWMTGAGDQCVVTETNQKDGWGTSQKFYTTRNAAQVTVPGGQPLTLGTQNFTVKYPQVGSYKLSINWKNGGLNIASATQAPTPSTFKKVDKVAVVNFDPTLSNGQKLTVSQGWENPQTLAAQYAADMSTASHGAITYQVVDFDTVDAFPEKADGFTYTEAEYLYCIAHETTPGACHTPDRVDYAKIFTDNDICSRVESGEIQEVWLFGGPYFGYHESTMSGNGAFPAHDAPVVFPCSKRFMTMGFNYNAGVTNMLHDFGHRVDATIHYIQQNQPAGSPLVWDQWGAFDMVSPGKAGCGSNHVPPNGEAEYDYANPRTVQSNCASWDLYPNAPGASVPTSCSAWGCTERGFLMWKLSHVPHNEGTNGTYQNDWWKYFVDYNTYAP